jgi:hypothetical protein
MAVVNPVGYLHNVTTHTAQVDRLASGAGLLLPDAAGALRPKGGVRAATDMALSAPGGMTVRVGGGIAYIPSTSSVGGCYVLPNDGNIDLVAAAAHATLPRHDMLVARVRDSFYSGALNEGDIFLLTGTAASSPVDPVPAAGAAYIYLGRVFVGPGVTSITLANITRLVETVAVAGGIKVVGASDAVAPIGDGQYRDHPTYGLQRGFGGAWKAQPNPAVAAILLGSASDTVSLPSGTWTPLPLTGVEELDTHGGHSTTVNPTRWTCPAGEDGLYLATSGTRIDTGLVVRSAGIRRNGTDLFQRAQQSIPTYTSQAIVVTSTPILLALAGGDYIEAMGYQNSGGALNATGTWHHLTVFRVARL